MPNEYRYYKEVAVENTFPFPSELAFSGTSDYLYPGKVIYDPVKRPAHYNQQGIECIDAIQASMSAIEFQGYLKGNAEKYLWRFRYKGKMQEDILKAEWYLKRLKDEISKEQESCDSPQKSFIFE